ncbi:unnamed protein product, partial [Allacma fusca]
MGRHGRWLERERRQLGKHKKLEQRWLGQRGRSVRSRRSDQRGFHGQDGCELGQQEPSQS